MLSVQARYKPGRAEVRCVCVMAEGRKEERKVKSLAKPLSFARAEKLGRRVGCSFSNLELDPGPCPHGAFQARPWERAGFSSVLTEANKQLPASLG